MDETNAVVSEETIPTEETAEQTESVSEDSTSVDETDAAQESSNDAETPNDEQTVDDNGTEKKFSIKFNHKDVEIGEEEARRLAQLGKHYEDNLSSLYEDLDYYATLQGKSVKDLVSELINGEEEKYREELVAELGADNPLINEMLEFRANKNKRAYNEAKERRSAEEQQREEDERKSANTRIAEQFESIQSEFPEYEKLSDIPEGVLKKAFNSGDLEKELYKFKLNEAKKIDSANKTESQNNKQSVGSAATDSREDGVHSAFMKGLWS